MQSRLALSVLLAFLIPLGCSEDREPTDLTKKDANIKSDAGTSTTTPPKDGGFAGDAGPDGGAHPDASGLLDAGSFSDASVQDTGSMDSALDASGPGDALTNDAETDGGLGLDGASSDVPVSLDVGTPDLGPYDGGVPQTDPFDPATIALDDATARCAYFSRCAPAVFDFYGIEPSTCATETASTSLFSLEAYAEAIAGGRAGFDQTAFDACLQAYANNDCVIGLRDMCSIRSYITGSQAAGQPCGAQYKKCVAGTFCGADPGASPGCGRCVALTSAGQPCQPGRCEPGYRCIPAGQQSLCIAVNVREGNSCGTVPTGLCESQLQCVGDFMTGPGTCERPVEMIGSACDPNRATLPGCNINQSMICSPTSNTCAQITWVDPGQTCDNDTLQCTGSSSACNQSTLICDGLPGIGQPCVDGRCFTGLYCDPSDTCQALKGASETCQSGAECQFPLVCYTGICEEYVYAVCQ